MARIERPFDFDDAPRRPSPPVNFSPKDVVRLITGFGIVGLFVFVPLFTWYFCRIEVEAGQIAVLIRKTGTDLPSGEILALDPSHKGIQLEVYPEGRYFPINPYTWAWSIHNITDIPAGKFGVQVRLYGKDLPPGGIIAGEGYKGIVENVLRTGKHRINPYAYQVHTFDAISIRPGHVGVVTALTGEDILHGDIPESARNTFLVEAPVKGVRPEILEPGTYYLNPFMVNVVEVNIQSQRFNMSGADAISFLTLDGFTVLVEGTIEFSLNRDKVALLSHRVGDMDDIIVKVILPRARGFSRIEGSKHPAVDFIVGETRQKFENELEAHLAKTCDPWGVKISSVLVRSIIPPDAIARVIREREVAVQNARKFDQQIVSAKSRAELARQEMLAQQNKEKVEAETALLLATINANKNQATLVLSAQKDLEVAKIDNQAADFTVESIRLKAEAEEKVIDLSNEAEASVLEAEVKAFGGSANWARHYFYLKLAPRVQSVLSGDGEGELGALLKSYLPSRSGK